MALVTRSAYASIDAATAMYAPQISGLIAGEDLDLVAPCYIKSSDGKVYMSNGTAADEEAEVVGFTARHVHSGEPVTLFGIGTRFRYGTGLTPGNILYLFTTDGDLGDAATTGDAFGYAAVVTATDIVIIRGQPVLTSATIGDATITLAKLVNLATGSLILGVANIPTAVDFKTTTCIPIGNGTTIAPLPLSGDATMANTGAVTIGDGKLDGKNIKETAAAAVLGAVPILYRFTIAAGALGNTDITITNKTRVIDAWLVLVGAGVATTTLQVFNGAGAITEAMAASGSAHALVRAAVIDHANAEVADSGTLRVTSATGLTQPDAEVYVLGLRLA